MTADLTKLPGDGAPKEMMVLMGITYFGRQDRPAHIVQKVDARKVGRKRTLCRSVPMDIGTPWRGPLDHVDCQRCVRAFEKGAR